jgi:hypothetical protein
MRYSIPRAAKMKDRAITLQDFADLAMQVPGVAKSTAQGQFYTNVKVYIAPVGGGYPTSDLRNAVAAYLTDRSLVGTTVEVHPLSTSEWLYQHVRLYLDLHVLPQYGQLTVTNAVTTALNNLFAFTAMSFGDRISQGDVYHAALAVPGVDYIVITAMQPYQADNTTVIAPTVQDIQVGATLIPLLDTTNANDFKITPYGGLT